MTSKIKRGLSLILASIMLVSFFPRSAFAAVELPTWTEETKEAKAGGWDLPQGTKLFGQPDAGIIMSNFGVTYDGHFINDTGRTVLKATTNQENVTMSPRWKHIAFKFDPVLYEMIDFENSYYLSSDGTRAFRFTSPTFGTSAHERFVAFENHRSGHHFNEVYLVLKSGKTWEDVQKSGDHTVQTRVYTGKGEQVWSKHAQSQASLNVQPGYTSYTQSFTITDLVEKRDAFINGRWNNTGAFQDMNMIKSTNLKTTFIPEEGILRVMYFYTHSYLYSNAKSEYKAFRQGFSKNLLPYLKKDAGGALARVYIGDHNTKPYKDAIGADGKPLYVAIKPENLILDEGMYNFMAASAEFKESVQGTLPEELRSKIAEAPKGQAQNYIHSTTGTSNPTVTIVDYNVDVESIERELLGGQNLAERVIFDSMYLEDSMPSAYFEYTLKKDLVLPKGSTLDVAYGKAFAATPAYHDNYTANIMFGDNKALDLIHNVTGGQLYGSSSVDRGTLYKTHSGMTLPAGTPIRIVNLEDRFSGPKHWLEPDILKEDKKITFTITKPDGTVLVNETLALQADKLHKPEIVQKSAIISSGLVQKSKKPLVQEVFTDSRKVEGLTALPNSWIYADYPNKDQRLFTYELDAFVPDETQDTEKYKIPTEKIDGETVGKVVTKVESGAEFNGYPYEFGEILENPLTKDMPIRFATKAQAKVTSDPVMEQVQAKVHFDLNGQTSKIDGNNFIEKIAPLNREYAYTVTEGAVTGDKNPNYVASGFAGLEEGQVVGGENLRIDETRPTVTVSQKLRDQEGTETTLNRQVVNFTDHNGQPYATAGEDGVVRAYDVNKLLKRQFPVNEEINLPKAKRIVGWTTVKLQDIPGGKTAQDQYYALLDAGNKTLRQVDDWAKAEDEAYVFDAQSPLDGERTVYAVYGGPTIVLHSGVNDAEGKEIIHRLPITQADIDGIDEYIGNLDATSQERVKTHTIIKDMPQAPYTDRDKDLAKAHPDLKAFKKDNHSFIGWRAYEDETNFVAGRNSGRIADLKKGQVSDGEGGTKPVPKLTESYKALLENKTTVALPNGFNFAIRAQDFGNYSTVEDIINHVDEIHLYAVYRPFFEITVHPQYQVVDSTTDPKNPKYIDGVDSEKQDHLKIGLLYRTAVTSYGVPTMDASANYNPIGDAATVLQTWDPKAQTLEDPKWTLPGFDILGQRRSYVSVVVPQGKEEAYTKFASPFSETSWSKLGISTYIKTDGNALDKTGPINLYFHNEDLRDPYKMNLAKTQAFELVHGTTVDAFTSATARKPLLNTKREVVGYDIVMTQALETLPTPEFERVKDTDKEIKLKWPGGEVYEGINRVELTVDGGENAPTYSLVKQADGSFAGENGLSAKIVNNQFLITGISLEGKGGKDMTAKFLKATSEGAMESAPGKTRILSDKTSAPVEEFKQTRKQGENPVVNFTVPDKTLDQVGVGSKYRVEKYDDKTDTWVLVGEKTLTEEDKVADKFGGNSYPVLLDPKKVKDGDTLRIVAWEANPDAEDGFSKPALSQVTVILDLQGPTGKITGKDESFRRFVNLTGELKDIPHGQEVTLEISGGGQEQGAQGNKKRTFSSEGAVISYLYQLDRQETMPTMWIIAEDKFGNQGVSPVVYQKTLQLGTSMLDAKARKKYVNVTADKDGAKVTLTVFQNGNTEVASGTVTIDTAGQYVQLNLLKEDGTAYRLKKGDRLHMTGILEEDGATYTANPVDKFIKYRETILNGPQTQGLSGGEGMTSLGLGISQDLLSPMVGAPRANNTHVSLKTQRIGQDAFDWSLFPNGKFTVKFGYTDAHGEEQSLEGSMTFTKEGTQSTVVNWPQNLGVQSLHLFTDFDDHYDIRAEASTDNSEGEAGHVNFTFTVYELPDTMVNVNYLDVYGNPLTDNYPGEDEEVPSFKIGLGDGRPEVSLPKEDVAFNIRDWGDMKVKLSEAGADAIYDSGEADADVLNKLSTLPITIDGETEGSFTAGTGDKAKDYKYTIFQASKKDHPMLAISYQADAITPQPDSKGTYPETPNGYTRLTFKAAQVDGEGKITLDGTFGNGEKEVYIDVKNGVGYDNESLKAEIDKLPPATVEVGETTYQQKTATPWRPVIPESGVVSEIDKTTYNAVYAKSEETIIPYQPEDSKNPTDENDPNIPKTDGEGNTIDPSEYVRVAFKVDPAGSGLLSLGDVTDKAVVSALVKIGTKWAEVTLPEKTPVENSGYLFWYWTADPAETVADGHIKTAKFVKDGDDITGNDNSLPDGLHAVTVAKGQGVEDVTDGEGKSLFGKTYAVKDKGTLAQAKFPTLTASTDYKNPKWYKDQETQATTDPFTVTITGPTIFTAKAIEETTADKVTAAGGLVAKNFGVWKDTEIGADFWKQGVAAGTDDEAKKAIINTALADATVADVTTPARSTTTKGDYTGNLKVSFKDGSSLTVEHQVLYVWENKEDITEENKNNPKPADSIDAVFKAGQGIKDHAEGDELGRKVVKPNTTLVEADFPV
ncbi:MAG: hypothetical protein Q4E37_02870 [Tissierellia bacterium]|nr:hypothetical protein [Tissierellia bacterium]